MLRVLVELLRMGSLVGPFHTPFFADDYPSRAKAPFDTAQAAEFQQQWAVYIGKPVVSTNSIGLKLALLPPGEFMMGRTKEQFDKLLDTVSNHPELKRNDGSQVIWSMLMMPAHPVRLTQTFYMGTTEVTVGQFRQFTDASGDSAYRMRIGPLPTEAHRDHAQWRGLSVRNASAAGR